MKGVDGLGSLPEEVDSIGLLDVCAVTTTVLSIVDVAKTVLVLPPEEIEASVDTPLPEILEPGV